MQLGRKLGCRCGTTRSRSTLTVPTPARPPAPPVIALQQQRTSVVAQAKRSSKRSKQNEGTESGDEEAVSGWDAALDNIPTVDEADEAPDSGPSQLAASASADRTAAQGPDPSASAPSTSYAAGSTPASSKKPKSTVLTLAEYTMLIEAKETSDKQIAARKEKAAREAAGGTALAVPEVSPLESSRQGFQAFALDGGDLELLVSETVDGKLLLSDSYVAAKPSQDGSGSGSSSGGGGGVGPSGLQYSRPKVEGDMPEDPLLFQVIPWVERGGSDMFKRKEASNKVKKVYFIGLEASEQGGLDNPIFDLDSVFVFDGRSRVLSRSEVRLVGTPPLMEPVLRIRASGLTLEESYLLPDPIEVSMNTAMDLADMSEAELEERLAELEKAAESLDEFDEMPDVPSVDMM